MTLTVLATALHAVAGLRAEDVLWEFLRGWIAPGWRVWSIGEHLLSTCWETWVGGRHSCIERRYCGKASSGVHGSIYWRECI
ncbi:hypothetical protein EDB83DRAFT_2474768 [Lactarius deliciosus]|nr:hypothetical protein EDB83DRAFT_2474768 [Lactarius deliciosus]